ncbi:MAG: 2-amino-4-hydroxy-6-hydroxymethyldihydropteridine diphosphokinase [Croceitalea sp.]|nr:2-amino-4-hydroxy-6-hydroxymethyldihydropteridine diphosphokinase [Croceitalea sp.]
MGKTNIVYLSLGSNLGNRYLNLQKAIVQLELRVGQVVQVSHVYENPAMGFEGDNFLNACLALETKSSPKALLEQLLQLEKDLGRIQRNDAGYTSRPIDIDIIYFGNKIVKSAELNIPHPAMTQRKFVLKPLADIAPQVYHPILKKDTRNLLQESKDESYLQKTDHTLYKSRNSLFSQLQFLSIEGNIGSGKTTLAHKIASEFNAKLVLERFADNPFLPKFYEDPSRFAFPLEMSFLADRYQQFTDDTSQFDLFKKFMVSDYDIFKSLIFAKITLQKDEFGLYRKMFNFMYKEVKKPDIYVYLYQKTDRLLENIKKRGRDYEQNIEASYLEKINRGYMDFMKSHPQQNSLLVDLGNLDFVADTSHYEQIIDTIETKLITLLP